MKNVSSAFKWALLDDDREYLVYADITLPEYVLTSDESIIEGKTYYTRTLVSGVYVYTVVDSPSSAQLANYYEKLVLHFTNSELWAGGFSYEESVSEDDNFTALGSAIVGSAKLIINNIDDDYTKYDFISAERVVLSLGMELTEGTTTRLEKFQIGVYTVDEASYTGGRVTLSLLDNMAQFDRPYSLSSLTYPNTLENIVNNACLMCGVTLGTLNFPHKTTQIANKPDVESTTFRDVISYCATIAGCFAKCNPQGQLELKWFDTDTLTAYANGTDGGVFDPWETADVVDGGSFNPWSTGSVVDGGLFSDNSRPIHFLSKLYSQRIDVDDVLITGVVAYIKDESDTATNDIVTKYSGIISGPDAYTIEISDNPFITIDNAQTIVDWLGTQLIGVKFRKLSIAQSSDPSIEAGDIAIVFDRYQHAYAILVTLVNFSADDTQTIVCGASTPSRNNATQYSAQTKSYVESRRLLKSEQTAREQAEQDLYTAIANSGGLYSSQVTDQQTGKTTYYLHNLPNRAESAIRMMFSDAGITVTSDSGEHWYGLTVSGDMLLNLLSTTGLNAGWINAGTLSANYLYGGTIQGPNIIVGGNNNTNGLFQVKDTSGTSVVAGDSSGMYAQNGGIIQTVSTYHKTQLTDGLLRFLTSVPVSGKPWLGERVVGEIGFDDSDGLSDPDGFRFYIGQNGDMVFDANYGTSHAVFNLQVACMEGIQVNNGLFADSVTSTQIKNRCITDTNYGDILTYCYETTTPMFGDIGFGVIGADGTCLVSIDDIFDETINTDNEYAVFIQKEGNGDAWVSEKDHTYFVVSGTPNLKFAWEIKVVQRGYETLRLDDVDMLLRTKIEDDGFLEKDFANELAQYDREVEEIFG